MKRIMDLVLAILLVVPAVLIMAVAALAVMIDSPGPPFFLQVRVGRGRKPFTMIKLRTMALGTQTAPSHEVRGEAITRVGAFLRKTKIDELPQIWSVLTGDMSFVGPRPCLPVQDRLISERARRGVYRVRPGITGPAQLAGIDMSNPVLLAETDAAYAANRSCRKDLAIIVATLLGGGRGDAVWQDQERPRK